MGLGLGRRETGMPLAPSHQIARHLRGCREDTDWELQHHYTCSGRGRGLVPKTGVCWVGMSLLDATRRWVGAAQAASGLITVTLSYALACGHPHSPYTCDVRYLPTLSYAAHWGPVAKVFGIGMAITALLCALTAVLFGAFFLSKVCLPPATLSDAGNAPPHHLWKRNPGAGLLMGQRTSPHASTEVDSTQWWRGPLPSNHPR